MLQVSKENLIKFYLPQDWESLTQSMPSLFSSFPELFTKQSLDPENFKKTLLDSSDCMITSLPIQAKFRPNISNPVSIQRKSMINPFSSIIIATGKYDISEKIWFVQDQEDIKGPFPSTDMDRWLKEKSFPKGFKVAFGRKDKFTFYNKLYERFCGENDDGKKVFKKEEKKEGGIMGRGITNVSSEKNIEDLGKKEENKATFEEETKKIEELRAIQEEEARKLELIKIEREQENKKLEEIKQAVQAEAQKLEENRIKEEFSKNLESQKLEEKRLKDELLKIEETIKRSEILKKDDSFEELKTEIEKESKKVDPIIESKKISSQPEIIEEKKEQEINNDSNQKSKNKNKKKNKQEIIKEPKPFKFDEIPDNSNNQNNINKNTQNDTRTQNKQVFEPKEDDFPTLLTKEKVDDIGFITVKKVDKKSKAKKQIPIDDDFPSVEQKPVKKQEKILEKKKSEEKNVVKQAITKPFEGKEIDFPSLEPKKGEEEWKPIETWGELKSKQPIIPKKEKKQIPVLNDDEFPTL